MNQPIINLAAVTWDFPLVGRTRLLTEAWRRAGQSATFVEMPHSWRSLIKGALRRNRSPSFVIRPLPPRWPARLWPRMSDRHLRRMMRAAARPLRRSLDRSIDWNAAAALVVSPMWTPWLEELPFQTVLYDCIDDLAVHVPDARLRRHYTHWEGELIDRADGAITTAAVLADAIRARRPDLPIATIRNGVDWPRFNAVYKATEMRGDRGPRPRPIVGFVGALYEWIDWPLIRRAAAALPDFDFVLVGPHPADTPDRIKDRPHVRLTGPAPYAEVPEILRGFDVCWVPFRAGDIAAAANPVKIYEYLAMGKPVVTTEVADTDVFEGLVRVGRDADQIIAHLREAATAPLEDRAARRAFARNNAWDRRADQIISFLASLPAAGWHGQA